jgi:hypothetical protein
MPAHTFDKILFQITVAITAIITITDSTFKIVDFDGTMHRFDGGSRDYDIEVKEQGTGKKNRRKVITIRKLLPKCPITGEYIPSGSGVTFKRGYALNKHKTLFTPHKVHTLNDVYYAKVATFSGVYNAYAVVKVVDGRVLSDETIDVMSRALPYDIVKIIADQHFQISDYNFAMMHNHGIIVNQPYTLQGLKQLYHNGIIEFGLDPSDGMSQSSIELLTDESYNYVYPNDGTSSLKQLHSHDLCRTIREHLKTLLFTV